MTNSKWKEVWMVRDGLGLMPMDIEKSVFVASVFSGKPLIQLYTTGQIRRRVECGQCDGDGNLVFSDFFSSARTVTHTLEKCPNCKGKGYVWEYKNK